MSKPFGVRCGNPQCDSQVVTEMLDHRQTRCAHCGVDLPHLAFYVRLLEEAGFIRNVRSVVGGDEESGLEDTPTRTWILGWIRVESLPLWVLALLFPAEYLRSPEQLRQELGQRLAEKLFVKNPRSPAMDWITPVPWRT